MAENNLFDQLRLVDDKRLAKKSVTLRLPVHVLARISAMCDIIPGKTRTDIIIELLKVGIDVFEKSLPEPSIETEVIDENKVVEFPVGVKIDYQKSANGNHLLLERELGNKSPAPFFIL